MATMETYYGQVRTPNDAIILFEACRLGILPRVQRRLSEKERSQIRSGSVFVWDEREAGMRRWTDGKSWSASRVSGSFLTYREMEGKRGGFGTGQKRAPAGPKSLDTSLSDQDGADEGPDGYRYKPDGLMKQSFSITTHDSRHLHLISYFSRSNSGPALQLPSQDPALRNVRPAKGMYPEATLNEGNAIPAVTRGPMGGAPPAWSGPQGSPAQYPYPPPHGYVQHGYPPGYPPAGHWPPTPSSTPGPYPYYHPPHGHSPYGYPPHPQHYAPPLAGQYPHPGQSYPPPPSTPTTLPPLVNGIHSPAVAQAQSPKPADSLRPDSAPAETAPATNGHKPASPTTDGASSAPPTATPGPRASEPTSALAAASRASAPPPTPSESTGVASAPTVASAAAASGTSSNSAVAPRSSTGATTIPSIGALLGQDRPMENGTGTPPSAHRGPSGIREMAHPSVVAGMDRDRSDLKRLDSRSLKFS